jgi:two-component system cell cycle sensor histidine kinase/response regulator CckA
VAAPDRKPTVLVIDDEPLVRQVTRRALASDAFVVEAGDGEEGLALLDQPQTTIDLVVTDFMMPRINGLGVIAVLARYRPELPVIGMTGHTDPALQEAAAKYGVRVLQKPFDIGILVASVRETVAANGGDGVRKRRQARAWTRRPSGAGSLVAAAKAIVLPIQVPEGY